MSTAEIVIVILAGAAAGVVATWLMTQVTTLMYNRESRGVRERLTGHLVFGAAAELTLRFVGT